MAHTATIVLDEIEGVNSAVYADLTFSGTYATGGELLVPSEFGLATIKNVEGVVTSMTTVAAELVYIRSTGKLALVAPAGTEVANATSLTGITVALRVLGA